MTVHRLDEAVVLVSWKLSRTFGSVHIQRPRSMKGLAYCGIRIPVEREIPRSDIGRWWSITIEDPWNIPLEIRAERDLANLCARCAKTFVDETVEEHASTPYREVPDLWKHFHARALRNHRAEVDAAELEQSTDPREHRPFGDALTAEEDAVAADDSLERQDEGGGPS